MEKTIEKLRKLYDEETEHDEAARESRAAQIKLCKKQLLGKCFRIKGSPDRTIEGEEYASYVCFTDVVEERNWQKEYYLLAVVVGFVEICEREDLGAQICLESNPVSNWLDLVDGAEEIPASVYNEAKRRAERYLGKKVDKVADED